MQVPNPRSDDAVIAAHVSRDQDQASRILDPLEDLGFQGPEIPGQKDRRPKWTRRFMPTCWATAQPLSGTERAQIDVVAYH